MSELGMFSISDQTSLWGLNVAIQATVLAVVSLLVALLFRRAAAMRYWVLCFGLVLVFVSPLITGMIQATGSSWLKITIRPAVAESVARTTNPDISRSSHDASQPNHAVQSVLDDSIESQPIANHGVNQIAASLAENTNNAAVQIVPPPEPIDPAMPTSRLRVLLEFFIAPLILIWVMGAAFLLLRMSIGWLRMSQILRAAKPIADERFQIAFERACIAVGCRSGRRPQLVASDAVSGPLAAGILRSKIVLPESLIRQLDPESLADVLIHEVAHVVRRDHIIVLLQNIVSAIYWPHPFVRKLNCELAKAREEVCDNFVLVATEAPTYSRTLLSLGQLLQPSGVNPGSVGFFTDRWKLEHRIAGLLDEHRNRTTFLSKRGWLFVAATTAVLTALTYLSIITIATAQVEDAPSPEVLSDATVQCRVVDAKGAAIAGAIVEVLKWTGTYDKFDAVAVSNDEGKVDLKFPDSDDYFYVLFKADGYASSIHSLQINAGEKLQIEFKLSPAARPWLRITADGQPLSGAEVARLSFVDHNQSSVHLEPGSSKGLGFEFSASDIDGRLNLPAVPEGATLSVLVVHPERRTAKLDELIATDKQLAEVELETGVPVTIKLSVEAQDVTELEGLKASISMLPSTGGSTTALGVRHEFPIHNGLVRFTASSVKYDELRFKMDDYLSTPLLLNYPQFPLPELDLSDGQAATLELTLRPKVKTRGRVVDAQGRGIEGAFVSSMISNNTAQSLNEDLRQAANNEADSSDGKTVDSAWAWIQNWSRGGDGQTDAEGYFEIDVAHGLVRLEVIRQGYFSSPVTTEAVVEKRATEPLPELVLYPVPELTGRVIDDAGQTVIGAIVRMRHRGRGDADPVGESSADGSFQLKISRIPYANDGSGLQTDVSVVAIDPKSSRGGIADVDLTQTSSTGEIAIAISEQSPDWALKVVQPEKSPKAGEIAKELAKRGEEYPDGVAGKLPPDLSEGTWLNTDARSLKDFRGKFVLLDFWFIGCGPCERDMPTIKMLHQKFFDQGFSVVSVHQAGQTPETVQKFANEKGMNYPIVVDTADGAITKQYKSLGVYFYPMYMLLDPDGKIIQSDATSMGDHSLRMDKIELIYRELRERALRP